MNFVVFVTTLWGTLAFSSHCPSFTLNSVNIEQSEMALLLASQIQLATSDQLKVSFEYLLSLANFHPQKHWHYHGFFEVLLALPQLKHLTDLSYSAQSSRS